MNEDNENPENFESDNTALVLVAIIGANIVFGLALISGVVFGIISLISWMIS